MSEVIADPASECCQFTVEAPKILLYKDPSLTSPIGSIESDLCSNLCTFILVQILSAIATIGGLIRDTVAEFIENTTAANG